MRRQFKPDRGQLIGMRREIDCHRLFCDWHFAGVSVLGRVHPDTTARGYCRRLSRQADRQRWAEFQPADRVRDHRRIHHPLPSTAAAAGGTASATADGVSLRNLV